jgi:hypothetical protein
VNIIQAYSHLNGREFLLVHRPQLYEEIQDVVSEVDAEAFRTKVSREKTMRGKRLYSPDGLNAEFARRFDARGWESVRYRYYVTTDRELLEPMVSLPLEQQRRFLEEHGVGSPILSYKQTDFVKDKIAIEVQFGKYAFVAYDLFVKHLLFYAGGVIDVGIEILPMKAMLSDPAGGRLMSTGIAYFEGEVFNVMRHGRNNPPVPLVIIGIAP